MKNDWIHGMSGRCLRIRKARMSDVKQSSCLCSLSLQLTANFTRPVSHRTSTLAELYFKGGQDDSEQSAYV